MFLRVDRDEIDSLGFMLDFWFLAKDWYVVVVDLKLKNPFVFDTICTHMKECVDFIIQQ